MPALPPTPPRPSQRPARNLLTDPIGVEDVERGLRIFVSRADRLLKMAALPLFLLALTYALVVAWSHRAPTVAARHRAEALAFQLAQAGLEPPMRVEISTSLIRGRAAPTATAEEALQQAMGYPDDRVLDRRVRTVGDFQLCTVRLQLPGESARWLVTGWREEGELEVLNLRFTTTEPEVTEDEREWGERLLSRVLLASNFQSAVFPRTRLVVPQRGPALPALGPKDVAS